MSDKKKELPIRYNPNGENVEIYEIDQDQAQTTYQNGYFTVVPNKPITIYANDIYYTTNICVDTQNNDSNTIVLPEDVECHVVFSLYDVNYDITNKTSVDITTAWNTKDYEYYHGYIRHDIYQLNNEKWDTRQWKSGRTVILTVTLHYIDESGDHKTRKYKGQTSNSHIITITPLKGFGKIDYRAGTLVRGKVEVTIVEGGKKTKGDPDKVIFETRDRTKLGGTELNLAKYVKTFILPEGRYTRDQIANAINAGLSNANGVNPKLSGINQVLAPQNPILQRLDDDNYQEYFWRRINDVSSGQNINFVNGNTYVYRTASTNQRPPYWVGAIFVDIEVDQTNQSFFANQFHFPLIDPSDASKGVIGFFSDNFGSTSGTQEWHDVKSATGIIFHEVEPASIWQDILGLKDKLEYPVITDPKGVQYVDKTGLEAHITYAEETTSTFPYFFSRDVSVSNPYYREVTNNKTIKGIPPRVNRTGGYYIVQIKELDNEYYIPSGYINGVIAILTTQYDNDDYITSYRESTIQHQHIGEPKTLSKLTVRILDSDRNVPNTLGEKNSLHFAIQRSRPPTLPATKDDIWYPNE